MLFGEVAGDRAGVVGDAPRMYLTIKHRCGREPYLTRLGPGLWARIRNSRTDFEQASGRLRAGFGQASGRLPMVQRAQDKKIAATFHFVRVPLVRTVTLPWERRLEGFEVSGDQRPNGLPFTLTRAFTRVKTQDSMGLVAACGLGETATSGGPLSITNPSTLFINRAQAERVLKKHDHVAAESLPGHNTLTIIYIIGQGILITATVDWSLLMG